MALGKCVALMSAAFRFATDRGKKDTSATRRATWCERWFRKGSGLGSTLDVSWRVRLASSISAPKQAGWPGSAIGIAGPCIVMMAIVMHKEHNMQTPPPHPPDKEG